MAGVPRFIASAAQGAVATAAMSAVMIAGDRTGLMGEQPSVVITRRALRDSGLDRPSAPASVIAPLAQLGFGAMGGLVYDRVRRMVQSVPGWILGGLFGLAVWAVSSKGWTEVSA